MAIRIELQPAYILHTRPYRDTSLLVDALTKEYGKISLVARGARKTKNNQRYLLQPFIPLLLSWQGNGVLKTLVGVELRLLAYTLFGNHLYSALYVNELLTYLLSQDDPSPFIYMSYEELLQVLVDTSSRIEPYLRCFEFHLLDELGYGINFVNDADTGEPFDTDKFYFFVQQHGFVSVDRHLGMTGRRFSGQDIIGIQKKEFTRLSVCQTAKILSREVFKPLLKGRKLKSRELFKMLITNKEG
ncbi:DNA repair protein RecO [Candidatus Endobugula sertula]|uniref:DNA repair protein RecO n=1 Tax=Candidatus Endobugula sertula TaxID=62101 RepID=A0A1D2QN50_9GAMM|nr:DNA repair protein RecO [Candidatus Endobugula sertula]